MRTVRIAAVLAAALVALAGAAPGYANYLATTAEVAKIRVGATTSKQVEALLGKPASVARDSRRGLDSWEYRGFEYAQRGSLWISFSSDGVVREVIQLRQKSAPGAV